MEALTSQNVRAEINALKEGESTPFPVARYDYVVSCCYRLRQSTGKKLSSKIQGAEVIVTRDIDKPE